MAPFQSSVPTYSSPSFYKIEFSPLIQKTLTLKFASLGMFQQEPRALL